ncbi:hypothetical protein [Telmatospirillum sp.]|uniref:hypothetical protein n=1 Tax=Telmatospirillum sp. TaxID=2079197 RepID=UPI0028453F98|nr:hypothetical protein [Telmatospirillum sp.]MDR3436389.1 hypothetical protein [Telmatospirillum sp.]
MKEFNLRVYGAADFKVEADTKAEAVAKLHKMFDRSNPVDPLTGRVISTNVTCQGFLILVPEKTEEFHHYDDPDV